MNCTAKRGLNHLKSEYSAQEPKKQCTVWGGEPRSHRSSSAVIRRDLALPLCCVSLFPFSIFSSSISLSLSVSIRLLWWRPVSAATSALAALAPATEAASLSEWQCQPVSRLDRCRLPLQWAVHWVNEKSAAAVYLRSTCSTSLVLPFYFFSIFLFLILFSFTHFRPVFVTLFTSSLLLVNSLHT